MECKSLPSHVAELVKKARECPTSHEALQYSQAACNVASAIRQLREIERLSGGSI